MEERGEIALRDPIPKDQRIEEIIMTKPKTDIAVAVYELHTQAETAVKALQRAGFDMKKISIIGKD